MPYRFVLMTDTPPISDASVREAIHARLWMQVMATNRTHAQNPMLQDWQPELELYFNEKYRGPGRELDLDHDNYPEDCAGERRLEDWLHRRGVVFASDDLDDMSQYFSWIKGAEPVLRASLAKLEIDEDWIGETALRQVLWIGAHFSKTVGPDQTHYFGRLPVGWGAHDVPPHFEPLINVLTQDAFCERLSAGRFSWTDKIADIGIAALPLLWNDEARLWEFRQGELRWIWHKMPLSIKGKHLRKKGPLDRLALDMDLSAFYDPATWRWSEAANEASRRKRKTFMRHLADELDRLDREVGLNGRDRR